jgi:diguanylate cyclase (GGDEF)-like protein
MFDVDHFKDINDDHGHVAGDRVLVAITELVREELRGLDRLARYSGEEFLIIAPNTTGQRAHACGAVAEPHCNRELRYRRARQVQLWRLRVQRR